MIISAGDTYIRNFTSNKDLNYSRVSYDKKIPKPTYKLRQEIIYEADFVLSILKYIFF